MAELVTNDNNSSSTVSKKNSSNILEGEKQTIDKNVGVAKFPLKFNTGILFLLYASNSLRISWKV
jgi:hypothetical protein